MLKKNQVVAATITGVATILAALISVIYLSQAKQGESSTQKMTNSGTPSPKGDGSSDPIKPKGPRDLDLTPLSGSWEFKKKTVEINGILFDDYGDVSSSQNNNNYATFDIRGYDFFEGDIGVTDSSYSDTNTLIIKVNGEIRQEITTAFKQPPQHVKIEITNAQSLTFERKGVYPHIIIGKPRLFRR